MKKTAYVAFILLGLIWGTNFIFMKQATAVISAAQVVLLRVLFGFVPILLFALVQRSLSWRHLRYSHHFLVMALLATVIYYYAFAMGATLLYSSVAGMLSGAIPLFSFVCALLFLRDEPINFRSISGMILGFAGVLLIARPWHIDVSHLNLEGVLYMIAGSLSVGCSFIYARKYLSPLDISPVALSTYQIGIALVVTFFMTDLNGIGDIQNNQRALLGLIFGLGLTGTGLAYILYYFIVQKLGALVAAGVTYIPPVVALLIGCFWAGDPIAPLDVIAMFVIMAGVFVMQTGRRNASNVAQPKKLSKS